ncbi:Endo-1,3-1,4-beta-glycanase ExsH [Planctomycetales bacterium 10988]|nr:Endo-1,3-1,4-beta-glycanase ExsH [Planctomycetales bacterium 10988]
MWPHLFSAQSSARQDTNSLEGMQQSPLQIEKLEPRLLLAGDPILLDLNPGVNPSNPQAFVEMNGLLFFTANGGTTGQELWRSDGTAGGTFLVKDIYTGSPSSYAYYLTNVNGTLFFAANDGTNGVELWRSDGTSAGTQLVKDIQIGGGSSSPTYLTNVNGAVYFSASKFDAGGSFGRELWMSDGTSAGTVLIKDINPGISSSNPYSLTNVSGNLFFAATNGSVGVELWKSDGTNGGTVLVKDIYNGAFSSYPTYITNVNGIAFFQGANASVGQELWKSDGTSAGTVLVKDINIGAGFSSPSWLINVNNTLFFSASNGTSGQELWKSDGTSSGTQLVKDINFGSGFSSPSYLTNVNNTLFFRATDGTNGVELWRSQGDSGNTVLVKDIYSGALASNPRYLANVGGTLYFSADNGTQGTELWMSNGTLAGTMLVGDLRLGAVGSYPVYMRNAGGRLFFTADNGSVGQEFWILSTDVTPPSLNITPDGVGANSSPIVFTFQFSEAVSGFTQGDIALANGIAGTFTTVNVATYTLQVTPAADGNVSVTVGNGVAFDGAGNGNLGDMATVFFDASPPNLQITPNNTTTNVSPVNFTFQFSEAVSGFAVNDIVITNGTAGTFTVVDGDTYTLQVLPTTDGQVTVSVPMGAAFDAGANPNPAASASITFGTVDTVAKAFAEILRRAADPGGYAYWSQIEASQGTKAMVEGLLRSGERYGIVVEDAYQGYLDRTSFGDSGRNYWIQNLVNRNLTITQFQSQILASGEYLANNPVNFPFIGSLSIDVWGRPITTAEQDYFANKLNTGTPPGGIVEEFFANENWRHYAINMSYLEFLGRPADPGGDAFWENYLETTGPLIAMLIAILNTDEFFS